MGLVNGLSESLEAYYLYHATKAELLRRSGHESEAIESYNRALALTANEAERIHLLRRRDDLMTDN
jgi:RNA polymerase sigma-70 factor, ECF subfamily